MILDIIDEKTMIGIGCTMAAIIFIIWGIARKINEIKKGKK